MTKSSPTIWHLLHNVKLTVKISSIFVAFLENMNFMWTAKFLFWVDFKNAHSDRSSFNPFIWGRLLLTPEFHSNCEFFKNSAAICFNTIWAEFCLEFHIVISKYFESNSYGSWLQLLWFMTHPFFNWFPGIKDYSNWPIIPQIRSEFFKNSNWSR